jgi:uncharacterized protein (TIGR02145 family)
MKKQNRISLYPFIIMGFVFIFSYSCKKDSTNGPANTVKDIDGNVYHTITIGNQTWMVENLKTTHFNDGTSAVPDAIPLVTDPAAWAALTTPGYCWFNNDEAANKVTFGALYNWYAANNPKLCPVGWHVPRDDEWVTLISNCQGESQAGGILKESGTFHWTTPNTGATNQFGFTALPGGSHYSNGVFYYIGKCGWYWSNTESSSSEAWHVYFNYNTAAISRISGGKNVGFSIRCIKDTPL